MRQRDTRCDSETRDATPDTRSRRVILTLLQCEHETCRRELPKNSWKRAETTYCRDRLRHGFDQLPKRHDFKNG